MFSLAALTKLMQNLVPPPRVQEGYTPQDMDEFVTVATYDNSTDAHIALGRLSAEGIEAVLFDDHMVQMDWLYAIALGGIKLRVTRGDEAAARKVLATDYSAVLSELDGDDTRDPKR
jgi:hypothetical protein